MKPEEPNDPPYVPAPRVLEAASYVELLERLTALDAPLRASAYVYGERIIVCRSIGSGLNVEVDDPVVVPIDAEDGELGRVLCDQLLAFRRGPLPAILDDKLSDWALFARRALHPSSSSKPRDTGSRLKRSAIAFDWISPRWCRCTGRLG